MGTQAVTIESGGFGYMQRYLFRVLYESEEPMTFAAICRSAAGEDFVLPSPVEQSLRRALKRMVDKEVIVATGRGGPVSPYRYCIHPRVVAMMGDDKPKIEQILNSKSA